MDKKLEKDIKDMIFPAGWGKDPLSEHLSSIQHNTLAAFQNLKPQYNHLKDINFEFKKISENLHHTTDFLPSLLLVRAYASFLGAVSLGMSGQFAETQMVLRGCLETSLYAFHIFKCPGAGEKWLKRNDDESCFRSSKDEFQMIKVRNTLLNADKETHDIAKYLYASTIDYGAHPNEPSVSSVTSHSKTESEHKFKLIYLLDYRKNQTAYIFGLKRCAEVGICSLDIFRLIFRERFDLLDITVQLKTLKTTLNKVYKLSI